MTRVKTLALVVGILALTAVTCSKAKVEAVIKEASARYLSCKVEGQYPQQTHTYIWREFCHYAVVNKTDRWVFNTWVSVQFSSGRQVDGLIEQLHPGQELDGFIYDGDSLLTYSYGPQFDTTGKTPRVTASVSVDSFDWK